jgi:protease I
VQRYLSEKRVAVLVADGFEQMQLTRPMQALRNAGATPDIISPTNRRVKGWRLDKWGDEFLADVPLESAKAGDYDALLLPGGIKNAETLISDEDAVGFVKAFHEMGKPVAAICHGVWLLLNVGITKGHRLTSCKELRRDLENAGAEWLSQKVVVDNGLVTSQGSDDIPEFNRDMIEAFAGARTAR